MALDESVKVPLPGQGIVKYKSGDVVYAYYITRIYRNEKGKPLTIGYLLVELIKNQECLFLTEIIMKYIKKAIL